MNSNNTQSARYGAALLLALALLLIGVSPARAQDEPVTPDDPNGPPAAVFDYVPLARPLTDADGADETSDAASSPVNPPAATPGSAPDAGATNAALQNSTYFPLLMRDHATFRADRMGFGAGSRPVSEYPQILELGAGSYVDWMVRVKPARPAGMEYIQMVRVHQKLTCPISTTADRQICPYASPPSYLVDPLPSVIQKAAAANPGSLWLIGNEMDRLDWNGGRMDEITPELYAVAYHDIRNVILAADPTARIAIGGVTQFTPARRTYLQTVWDTYKQRYGAEMPVDVWNTHNFILSEFCQVRRVNGRNERICYGTGMPPGQNENRGSYVGEDWRHVDISTFRQQIFDMRQWMKQIGEQDKPLIVSEYGVLYSSLCPQSNAAERQRCIERYGSRYVEMDDPSVVQGFMLDTFRFFTDARNCDLSAVDDCRLVQQWVWFSLDWTGWFNSHGILADPNTRRLREAGYAFGAFARENLEKLQFD